MRQTIIWTNADPIYSHIYAALGGDELVDLSLTTDVNLHNWTVVMMPTLSNKMT